jgi:uncharacterized protein YutE (UPF0331/DUF86 family)
LADHELFFADRRNLWTAESCLRRALEALLDLGRHLLAKGFGLGVTEYKDIAAELGKQGALSEEEADLLRTLAGYRNRLVHFYHEVEPAELFDISATHLADVERLAAARRDWLNAHPELLDEDL